MAAVAAARGGPRRISAGQVWHGLLAVLVIAALVTQVVLTSQPSAVPLGDPVSSGWPATSPSRATC